MIITIREFNNGLFDCVELKSDKNCYLLDKSNEFEYETAVVPVFRIDEIVETDHEIEEENNEK